jgi:hypothetical protein
MVRHSEGIKIIGNMFSVDRGSPKFGKEGSSG